MFRVKRALLFPLLAAAALPLSAAPPARGAAVTADLGAGRRSTSEDSGGEDRDDDYKYQRHRLDLDSRISRRAALSSDASFRKKDYDALNELDHHAEAFGLNPEFLLREAEGGPLKLDLKGRFRRKRYENRPSGDYNHFALQSRLALSRRALYNLAFSAGWSRYVYPNVPDRDFSRSFQKAEAGRYFLDEILHLKSALRLDLDDTVRPGGDKTKYEISAGASYRFSRTWLEKVEVAGAFGKRDAKETEDLDEDLDYSFAEFGIKTEHALSSYIRAAVHYRNSRKDYKTALQDSNGHAGGLGMDFILDETPEEKSWVNLDGEYRTTDFSEGPSGDYRKLAPEIKYTYQKKEIWKVALGGETVFYDYEGARIDKIRYGLTTEASRRFKQERLVLALLLKYRFNRYSGAPDDAQESANLTVRYKF